MPLRTLAPFPPRTGLIQSRILTDSAELATGEWESLLQPGDNLAEPWFARACHAARPGEAELRFLEVREDENLIGVAAFFRMLVSLDLLAGPVTRRIASGLRRVHPGALRLSVAFCGLPVSFGDSMLRWSRPGSHVPVVRSALGALERLAEEWRTPLLCLKEFTDSEAASLDPLLPAGWLKLPSLPGSRLSLSWRSVPEYVAALRANYRRQWLAAGRAAGEAGVAIAGLENPLQETALLYRLYLDVMERAPHQLERLNATFFERLLLEGGDRVRVWVARRDTRPLGMALAVTSPERWIFLLAGLESQHSRSAGVYPALVQRVVAEAIESGARSIELGQTAYDLKGRLGAQATPRWIYLRARSPLVHRLLSSFAGPLFPATAIRARRVFRSDP